MHATRLGLRWGTVAALGVGAAWLVFLMKGADAGSLTGEAGPVESLGALCWLLASILCLVAFARSSTGVDLGVLRLRKNLFLLLLALLFLFAGGEEISWGQHMLGFATPEGMVNVNRQREFNVHNLPVFHAQDASGRAKTGLEAFLSMERLFALFWLGYCVIVPVLVLGSGPARRLAERVGLPVVPLALGLAFPLNYGIHKALEYLQRDMPEIHWANVELKESVFAFLFLLVALYFARVAVRGPDAAAPA